MNKHYYIAVNGQQTGPFTFEELKSKNLIRTTLVWTEGMEQWTKAEEVAYVKDILHTTPPPIPNAEHKQQTPPSIPFTAAPTSSSVLYHGYRLATRTERFFGSFIEGLIIVIIAYVFNSSIFDGDYFSFSSLVTNVIIGLLIGAIFYPSWSGNLGHKIMGLKVIAQADGKDQNTAQAGIKREVVKYVLGMFILPMIWLLWDDKKQNLYDKVVDTIVVKK